MPEHRIRLDRTAAGLQPAERRDERADVRRQTDGLAVVGLRRLIVRGGIVVAERGRERSQRVHRVAVGQHPHQPQNRLWERARGGQLRLKVPQFGARRQPPVPQEITDFFEGGVPCEIVDVVTAIRQHAAVAVEIADGGRRRDGIFKPCFGLGGRGHAGSLGGGGIGSSVAGRLNFPGTAAVPGKTLP